MERKVMVPAKWVMDGRGDWSLRANGYHVIGVGKCCDKWGHGNEDGCPHDTAEDAMRAAEAALGAVPVQPAPVVTNAPLSRRDMLAGMALQGLLADPSNDSSINENALEAALHADALIAALDGKGETK